LRIAALVTTLAASLLAPGTSFPRERVGAMVHLPERLAVQRAKVVEEALSRVLAERGGASAVAPDQVFSRLAREARGRSARRRAADLLAKAVVLVDRVRYIEAVAALEQARSSAVAGHAQLVDPKLLADVDFQLGVVRHVMQHRTAGALLERSFALWPRRALDPGDRSPKVARAIRDAAARARRSPPPLPGVGEMRHAARVSGVERLVLVTPSEQTRSLEVVDVRVFRHRRGWTATRKQVWPSDASVDQVASRLGRTVGELLGLSDGGTAGGTCSRWRPLAWTSGALAVALAGTSAALFVVSHQRVEEAESLGTNPPSVEYADEAQGLESSARSMRTGAIVTLALAGAAAAGAVVLWIATRAKPGSGSGERRLALQGAGVLVRF